MVKINQIRFTVLMQFIEKQCSKLSMLWKETAQHPISLCITHSHVQICHVLSRCPHTHTHTAIKVLSCRLTFDKYMHKHKYDCTQVWTCQNPVTHTVSGTDPHRNRHVSRQWVLAFNHLVHGSWCALLLRMFNHITHGSFYYYNPLKCTQN